MIERGWNEMATRTKLTSGERLDRIERLLVCVLDATNCLLGTLTDQGIQVQQGIPKTVEYADAIKRDMMDLLAEHVFVIGGNEDA